MKSFFGDLRIDLRVQKVLDLIVKFGTTVINRWEVSGAIKIGAYRVLNNNKLKMEDLTLKLATECADRCKGHKHVLCIQDTKEFNFDNMKGRLSKTDPDFGYGTNKLMEYSIYAHPCMVVSPDNQVPLGFSSINVYNHDRKDDRQKSKQKADKTLEEKESYRWAEAALLAKKRLPSDVRLTMVGDRENDAYSVLCKTIEAGCDFVIRSFHNRMTDNNSQRISDLMDSIPVSKEFKLEILGSHNRKSRTARMELRYSKVTLLKSAKSKDAVPEKLDCWCIYVKEKSSTVPDKEEPIEWRLLTSHPVDTNEMAIQCVEWYKCRWNIEELFYGKLYISSSNS